MTHIVSRGAPRTMLLATDGSSDARRATTAAIDIARSTGARLCIASVAPSVVPLSGGFVPVIVPPGTFEAATAHAQRVIDAARISATAAGVTVASSRVLFGPAISALIEEAEEVNADIIVVGSRGHSAVARLVLGSVSEGILHRARRPVLIVRGEGDSWPQTDGHDGVAVGDDALAGAGATTPTAVPG